MDCLVALGAVVQATTTLTIGTAVALLPERDPSRTVSACTRPGWGRLTTMLTRVRAVM
jgi:hypothetical protein